MELSTTLFQLSNEMRMLEDALWESGGELTPEIEQALAENAESMAKKVDGYNAVLRSFAYKSDVLDAEIKRLNALKKTAENAQKRIREHVVDIMNAFDIDKLEGAYCKINKCQSSKVEVKEETILKPLIRKLLFFNKKLPPYVSAEYKINKTILKDYIKETGITPAGVEFVNSDYLRIK
jgi:hypothetical protein